MKHVMKQENMSHSHEKLTEIISEEKLTLNLPDKDFKSTILNMFKELKETRRMMYEQIENIHEETEIIKGIRLKSITKNSLEGFNSRFELAEE